MKSILQDYDFYNMKDSFGSDISFHPNLSLYELKEMADKDDNCIAFNTHGWLKHNVPSEDNFITLPGATSSINGLYVKRKKTITVILNIYKRPHTLKEQFEAIINQTIKPKKIFIWNNGCKDVDFDFYKKHSNVTFFDSNNNLGVWSRFIVAMNTNTDYVCVFDDDTIPGKKWFENCINTLKTREGLLGTIGVVFKHGSNYTPDNRYGWANPNDTTREVDIVGHSWFFKRDLLEQFMKEIPNLETFKTCGEDIHFSYVLQKYTNLKTYVPPHPKNNIELWGSMPDKALKYGIDSVAISINSDTNKYFDEALKYYQRKGFETIKNKEFSLRNYNLSINYFLNKIARRKSFCLIRLGDGEYNILINKSLKVAEGWSFKEGSILTNHLKESINIDKSNVYYGISAPCDLNGQTINNYYVENIKNNSNLTFANILCNNNYQKFKNFIQTASMNVILISCNKPDNDLLGKLKIIEYYKISSDLVDNWDKEYKTHLNKVKYLSKKYTNEMFFISGGPIAKVFIATMYKYNPNNMYIDVGSTIDPFTKGVITRPYQKDGSNFNSHICKF
jgi:hypothetical protein